MVKNRRKNRPDHKATAPKQFIRKIAKNLTKMNNTIAASSLTTTLQSNIKLIVAHTGCIVNAINKEKIFSKNLSIYIAISKMV